MARPDVTFAVGDLVRWTSQARGVRRSRVGVVAAVVPPDAMPFEHMPAGRWRTMFRDNATRPRVSYLVALKNGGRGAGVLHHPHVGTLSLWSETAARSRFDSPARAVLEATTAELVERGVMLRPDLPPGRALVVYRPRWSRRDRIIAVVAAPIILGLLALIVVGMQGVVPA